MTSKSQPLLIANMKGGLERDLEPWLLPNDAFPTLENLYMFRGRVRRKEGNTFVGRLTSSTTQQQLGIAPGTGIPPYTTLAGVPLVGAPIEQDSVSMYITDSTVPPTGPILLRTYTAFGEVDSGGFQALRNSPETAIDIATISNAVAASVTTSSPHGFTSGDITVIQDVTGMCDPTTGISGVNKFAFVVTVTGVTTFTIPLDTTLYSSYVAGGNVIPGGRVNLTTGTFDITYSLLVGVAPFNLLAKYQTGGFPCEPAMGIRTREIQSINLEETIFFNQTKSNIYSQSGQTFVDTNFYKSSGTAFSWSGNDSDFFWSINYQKAFWATNDVEGLHPSFSATGTGDGIRWYDGDSPFSQGWVNFNPLVSATDRLLGAKLIISYFGRLVVFNTVEGTTTPGIRFSQRARWSKIGTPYPALDPGGGASPVPQGFAGGTNDNAWRSDIAGQGGFIDASTSEHIVSLGWYKDQLIVFFERSTWALLYTGNILQPFIWQRIHSEFGCESKISPVQFDNGILAIGDKAIINATSTSVERIDLKIPDEVFDFHNDSNGHTRVHGIRDYFRELVYWTFPNSTDESPFPDRILVYNYREGSFSFFRECYTALGTLQFVDDLTWDEAEDDWDNADFFWDGAQAQSRFPQIVGGNQQGFISLLNISDSNGITQEVVAVDISNPTQVLVEMCGEHCLQTNDFIKLTEINGLTNAIVGEAVGTALEGTTVFNGTLSNLAIERASVIITIGANIFTDPAGNGVLDPNGGCINYETGAFEVCFAPLGADTPVTSSYTQTINGRTFKIIRPSDPTIGTPSTTIQLVDFDATGFTAYIDGGFLTRVDNFRLLTKRFSPFVNISKKTRFDFTEWFLEKTVNGEFTLRVLYDTSPTPYTNGDFHTIRTRPEDIVGSDVEQQQERIWHRTYVNALGNFIQFELFLSDEQMLDADIQSEEVTLHAMMLYADPVGRLV